MTKPVTPIRRAVITPVDERPYWLRAEAESFEREGRNRRRKLVLTRVTLIVAIAAACTWASLP